MFPVRMAIVKNDNYKKKREEFTDLPKPFTHI